MKFNCGLTETEKCREQEKEVDRLNAEVNRGGGWVRWFAWYPVRVGTRDCRWLEFVEYRCSNWVVCPFHDEPRALSLDYRAIKENTDGNV